MFAGLSFQILQGYRELCSGVCFSNSHLLLECIFLVQVLGSLVDSNSYFSDGRGYVLYYTPYLGSTHVAANGGVGQNERPLLRSVFSSSDKETEDRFITVSLVVVSGVSKVGMILRYSITNLSVMVLEVMRSQNEDLRKRRESYVLDSPITIITPRRTKSRSLTLNLSISFSPLCFVAQHCMSLYVCLANYFKFYFFII